MKRTSIFIQLTILILCICTSVNGLFAQSFVTRVSENTIGLTDILKVSYELENADFEDFRSPDFQKWTLRGGPNMSSSVMTINGNTTQTKGYTYFLEPTKKGIIIVPGAKAKVNGKWIESKSVSVQVIQQSAVPPSTNIDPFEEFIRPKSTRSFDEYDAYILKVGENPAQKINDNLFVRVITSKTNVYDGEPLLVDFKLYSRVDLQAQLVRRPTFTGCSVIDLALPNDGQYTTELYEGKMYRVFDIRKVQLYPLQAGNLQLQPLEIEAEVKFTKVPSTAEGLANYDMHDPINQVKYKHLVKSKLVTIPVKAIPGGQQAAVGNFAIASAITDTILQRNQPAKLIVTITGSGRWTLMKDPEILWPKGIQPYPSNYSDKIDSNKIPIAGQRTYVFPFTATDSGQLTIPAINMSYFDPNSAQTKITSTKEILLQISGKQFYAPKFADNSSGGSTDYTELFIRLVKRIIPILLIGLVFFIWWGWHKKRKKMLQLNEDAFTSTQLNDDLPVWTSGTTAVHGSPTESKPKIISETMEFSKAVPLPKDAKTFFENAKKTIELALQLHPKTRENKLINNYLQQCNQAIYGPPIQDFDSLAAQQELDIILAEIV